MDWLRALLWLLVWVIIPGSSLLYVAVMLVVWTRPISDEEKERKDANRDMHGA